MSSYKPVTTFQHNSPSDVNLQPRKRATSDAITPLSLVPTIKYRNKQQNKMIYAFYSSAFNTKWGNIFMSAAESENIP